MNQGFDNVAWLRDKCNNWLRSSKTKTYQSDDEFEEGANEMLLDSIIQFIQELHWKDRHRIVYDKRIEE
jgi:hypothetical protein